MGADRATFHQEWLAPIGADDPVPGVAPATVGNDDLR